MDFRSAIQTIASSPSTSPKQAANQNEKDADRPYFDLRPAFIAVGDSASGARRGGIAVFDEPPVRPFRSWRNGPRRPPRRAPEAAALRGMRVGAGYSVLLQLRRNTAVLIARDDLLP